MTVRDLIVADASDYGIRAAHQAELAETGDPEARAAAIAFSIVEGVRGRAVGREIYERVSVIGIALVLLLFFIGISNDVGRLGGS